jgi:hypothetical protein
LVVTILVTGNPTAQAQQSAADAHAIEALFMGSGPLTPSDGFAACPFRNFWSGFPRGTEVTVRVSTTVPASVRRAIQSALRQIPQATRGAIRTKFELTDDPNPTPRPNEVTSTIHPDPVSQGCPFDRGCIMHQFERGRPGVFRSGRAVQPAGLPVNAYVHDVVGHGILGFCHIDGNRIGGPENSLMSGGPGVFSGAIAARLTAIDMAAATAAYGSALSPGAARAAFMRAVRDD